MTLFKLKKRAMESLASNMNIIVSDNVVKKVSEAFDIMNKSLSSFNSGLDAIETYNYFFEDNNFVIDVGSFLWSISMSNSKNFFDLLSCADFVSFYLDKIKDEDEDSGYADIVKIKLTFACNGGATNE